MPEPTLIALVCAAFLAGGLVKGVVGLGMPTVTLSIMAATIGLKEAVVLMLVPTLATNVWQALRGGALSLLLRRLWPFLALTCLGIWFGVGILAEGDARLLAMFLGCLLCFYSIFGLAGRRLPAPGRWEPVANPLVGAAAGLINGMTGSFIVPGVIYLQALGLGRDHLVQAMGICFSVATVAIMAAAFWNGLFTLDLGGLSVAALAPSFLGMALGTRVRARLSEEGFKKVLFAAFLMFGIYLVARNALF